MGRLRGFFNACMNIIENNNFKTMRLCLFLPYIRNKHTPQLIHLVIILATSLVMCAQHSVNSLHIYTNPSLVVLYPVHVAKYTSKLNVLSYYYITINDIFTI